MVLERNNFKKIAVVPNAKDMVDAFLSRQRYRSSTPAAIHKGSYPIPLIREFYMIQRLKSTETYFNVKLTVITDDFPRLDSNSIHPFYADLLDNKDRYTSALDQIDAARTLITTICNHYVKLYLCNSLKHIAIGRMCTVIKRIEPSLAYLEHVRQDMARHPAGSSVDPDARTIIMVGYPCVGKSSFMHKMITTRAPNPYASCVGHTEYENLKYQVINVSDIENINLAALAHLRRAAVLFFLDLPPGSSSGTAGGGYYCSIGQQAALFRKMRSVLMDKPLTVVLVMNGGDYEALSEEDRRLVEEMTEESAEALRSSRAYEEDKTLLAIVGASSTMSVEGVMYIKNAACRGLLINQRVELMKMNDDEMIRPLCKLPAGEFRGGYNIVNVCEVDIDPYIERRLEELEREEEEGIAWKGMGWQLSRL